MIAYHPELHNFDWDVGLVTRVESRRTIISDSEIYQRLLAESLDATVMTSASDYSTGLKKCRNNGENYFINRKVANSRTHRLSDWL